jgi:hypothetical protein
VTTAVIFYLVVVIDTRAYDLAVLLDITADYTARAILPPKFLPVPCKAFHHKLDHFLVRI